MMRFFDILKSFIPGLESLPSIPSVSGFGPGWLFGTLGAVAISLFGLSIGRTRAVMSILSIYVALAFDRLFPFFKETGDIIGDSVEEYWIRLGIFLAAYIIVFLVFNFSFIRKRISSQEYSLFGILVLSVLQFGFLASIIFNILPEDLVSKFIPYFYIYFSTPTALFVWALSPLPVLLFIRK